MHGIKVIISIIGRICLSAIFILAGLNKILNWDEGKKSVLEMLSTWSTYSIAPWMSQILTMASDHIGTVLGVATIFELLGGVLVLFGIGSRFGAFLLILFTIPTTILFHAFWELQPPERDIQVVMFMKNAAILGGLLMVLAFGAGFRGHSSSSLKEPL
jgi:putative oxidoreductase